jgi:ABC-2 type transport system permease protein
MTTAVAEERPVRSPSWRIVAEQECRDLWISGRGPILLCAFSVLLSVITYLAATNQVLNFLEQREAVNLTLVVAITVGVLVTLLVSADAISGERERGTLETLLLSPASRRGILLGKLTAALSLWLGAYLVAIPYIWVLGRGVSLVGKALLLGFVVGTLVAVALAAFGLLVSAASNSNKVSLSVSFLVLLALFAPTQLPPMPTSWINEMLTRVNPLGSGTQYLSSVLVKGHSWTADPSYLISPVIALVVAGGLLLAIGPRTVRLTGGNGS